MAHFKDLNSLFNHLHNQVIPDVMGKEVLEVVKQVQSRKVQDEVYSTYDPFVYQRRGWSGGLADQKNIVGTLSYGVNQVNMMVSNITKGSDQDFYIAGLVEYGHNNGYGAYQYPFNRDGTQNDFLKARPFISQTMRHLEASLQHIDAFKRGLKRHGINTY